MSITTIAIRTFACAALLASAACSGNVSSPTAPSTVTAAPVPVAGTASVQVTITPNPVEFSGQPITDAAGCAGSKNTWFYEQALRESGGVALTVTSRIDKFDDRIVNNVTGLNLAIPAMGALTLQSRWCSSQAVAHTAQSSFTGTDANGHTITADGPVVNLKSP